MENAIKKFMTGEKLYEQRARKALPLIVRHALNGEKVTYSELAKEIGMPNPRNLNFVLGCIGSALEDLSRKWNKVIPPINSIVTNQNTGYPSDGIAWFINKKKFDKLTPEKKKETLEKLFIEVFNFSLWLEVLEDFKLKPLNDKVYKGRSSKREKVIESDIAEQERFEGEMCNEDTEKLKEMLRFVDRTKEVCVEVNGKIWKRNNALVCLIKRIRGNKCQICGHAIKKKNGDYYTEGAHIISKNTGLGRETPDNIVVLCPNHHKEFDLGDREIIEHTKDTLIFRMNGKEYKVNLS